MELHQNNFPIELEWKVFNEMFPWLFSLYIIQFIALGHGHFSNVCTLDIP